MSGKSAGESTEALAVPKRSPTRWQANQEKTLSVAAPVASGSDETWQVPVRVADEAAKRYTQRHYNSARARASGVGDIRPAVCKSSDRYLCAVQRKGEAVWWSGVLDDRAKGNGKLVSTSSMLEIA